MISLEIEEVLTQARMGLWNIRTTIICLCGVILTANSYTFSPLIYGEMAFNCNPSKSHRDNATIANDHCSYVYQNKSYKCKEFYYTSDEFQSTFVSRFDLVCDRADYINYNLQVLMIGQMISTLFCNVIMDKIGRKLMFLISSGIFSICSLLYIIVPFVEVAIFVRLIDCIVTMSMYVSGFVLIIESLPPKYRILGSSGCELSYGIGIAFSAIVTLIHSQWRFFVYFRLIIPALLVFIAAVIFLDESPKWLLQMQYYHEVTLVIRNIYRVNKTTIHPSLAERVKELEFQKSEEAESKTNILQLLKSFPFWQLFRTVKTAIWMAAQCLNWITCVVVYFGLLFSPKFFNVTITYFFLMIGLSTLPACMLQCFLAKVLGRRITMILSLVLTAVCLITGAFVPEDDNWTAIRYIIACSSFFFVTAAFLTIYVWHGELMPTNLRAVGLGIGSLSGRCFGIFMIYIFEFLESFWAKLPILFLAAVALTAAGCSLLVPETRDNIMPDNIEEYECYGTERYTEMKNKRQALVNVKA